MSSIWTIIHTEVNVMCPSKAEAENIHRYLNNFQNPAKQNYGGKLLRIVCRLY